MGGRLTMTLLTFGQQQPSETPSECPKPPPPFLCSSEDQGKGHEGAQFSMFRNDKFTTDGLSMLSCLSDNAYDKVVFTIAGASRLLTKRWPNGQRLRTLLALATLVIRVEHVRSPLALLIDYATARGRGIECRRDPHTKGGTRGHYQRWFSKAEHTLVLLNEYREACSELRKHC